MSQSESIGDLAKALSQLQGEIQDVFKGSMARNSSYADLEACLKIARPLMKKNALALSQMPQSSDASGVSIKNILMHDSGQWISSVMFMPLVPITSRDGKQVINQAQQMGSAITYARRYCLLSILGYTQTEDDNDGDSLTQDTEPKFKQHEQKQKEEPAKPVLINHDQALVLLELIGKAGYTEQKIILHYSKERLLDFTVPEYEHCKGIMAKKIAEKEEAK
jgi:hypothetical protein